MQKTSNALHRAFTPKANSMSTSKVLLLIFVCALVQVTLFVGIFHTYSLPECTTQTYIDVTITEDLIESTVHDLMRLKNRFQSSQELQANSLVQHGLNELEAYLQSDKDKNALPKPTKKVMDRSISVSKSLQNSTTDFSNTYRLECDPHHATTIPFFIPAIMEKPVAKIPRRMFVSSRFRNVTSVVCNLLRNALHMNQEWDFYFFDDNLVEQFMEKTEFKPLKPLFDTIQTGAIKIDLWRYLAILKFGGIYFDLDATHYAPLREIVPTDVGAVSGAVGDGVLCQWSLIYRPGHFIMAHAARESFHNVLKILEGSSMTTHEFRQKKFITGPPALSSSFVSNAGKIKVPRDDRMVYYLSQSYGNHIRNTNAYVKREQKSISTHWSDKSSSVFRSDLDRELYRTDKALMREWKKLIDDFFARWNVQTVGEGYDPVDFTPEQLPEEMFDPLDQRYSIPKNTDLRFDHTTKAK